MDQKTVVLKTTLLFSLIFCCLSSLTPSRDADLREDILSHTNKLRKSKRLPELVMLPALNDIAQEHSKNMAKGKVSFGHGGFEKRSRQAREKVDGTFSFAENVAYGVNSGKEVVDMWKGSPGHRKNMLGNFTYIGIGTAKDRNGVTYFTQVFVK